MGKTKSKSLRKTAKTLKSEGVDFKENFEENKKILAGLELSKKLRNQLAGLFTRTKKQEIAQAKKNE